MNNNDKIQDGATLSAFLAGTGIEEPKESEIDMDSYEKGMDPQIKKALMEMRSKQDDTNKQKYGDGEEFVKVTTDEPTFIKIDEDTAFKKNLEKASKMIDNTIGKEDQKMYDDAIAHEEERLKQLMEDPTNDPNYMPRSSKKSESITNAEINNESIPDENDVGEVLGKDWKPSVDEDEDDDSDFIPDIDDDTTNTAEINDEQPAYDGPEYSEKDTDFERRMKEEEYFEKKILELQETSILPKDSSCVKVVKAKVEVQNETPSSVKEYADQAFMNALTKMRRKNYRIIEVPLLNSGFVVEVNGLSAGDLTALYDIVSGFERNNISAMDYLNAVMKTVAKAIVKVTPRFDTNKLIHMIHYSDLNLLMYALVAATLDDVKYPIESCEGCGKGYRISVPSSDIILNEDEIKDRVNVILNAKSIQDSSLLEKSRIVTFESGMRIVLGHASVWHQRKLMKDIENYSDNNLSELDMIDLLNASRVELPWVRGVILPNGIQAKGPFQITKALGFLEDDERRQIMEHIREMEKELIPVEFGVMNVKCPHCGHIVEKITFPNLSYLVFYHTRASRAMIHTMKK